MSTWGSIKAALQLLQPGDRKRLGLVAFLQSSLAFLDLLGIVLIGLVAGLSASLLGGEIPTYLQGLVSAFGLQDADLTKFTLLVASAAAAILIGKSALSYYLTRRMFTFLAIRQGRVSGDLARRFLFRPLLAVQEHSSQQSAYALTAGVNAIFLGILGSSVVLVAETSLLIVLAIGLAAVDPIVCLFTIAFFGTIGLIVHRVLSGYAGRIGAQIGRADIASIVTIQEAIRAYRELAVSGRRHHYVDQFEGLRSSSAFAQADAQMVNLIPKYVFEAMMVVGGGLLVVSQILTRDTATAVAIIAVYLAAASRVLPSILRLQSSFIIIRNSTGIAESTYKLIAELDASEPSSPAVAVDRPGQALPDLFPESEHALELDGICFTFPGAEDPTLSGITLSLRRGCSLAIVGPTGAGKSTLVDIAMGLLAPDEGRVRISGADPATAIESWPGAISCVPQDVSVVEGTIRSNVALGLPSREIDDEAVWDALDKAQLSTFLTTQRNGLETVVGEHGVKLSGGQRQRLGLARALYSRPHLLFLDEATSALDAETERDISETLSGLAGRVSLVVIAHRLATVRSVDQVAYLEEGRLLALDVFENVRRKVPDFDRQARLLGL
jgi:ABC-type multidrug transport system fused ATPase/permease subunit